MPFLKSPFHAFILGVVSLLIVSCVPSATEKKAVCGANQVFNTVTRSCQSTEEKRYVPVGTKSSETILEERPQIVTLTYTDANKDKALTCKISSVSSNIEVVAPSVVNGDLLAKADELAFAVTDYANAVPSPDNTSALAMNAAITASLNAAKGTLYYPTFNTQITNFRTQIAPLLALASSHLADVALQAKMQTAQETLDEFTIMTTAMTNRCECTTGVCQTQVIPKMNKSGGAGFSYVVTDTDGDSVVRPVSITITPMARTAAHLVPTAESSYDAFNESATITPTSYAVNIPSALDPIGTLTTAFQYSLVSAPTKGTLTSCMSQTGSTGTNDRTCIYTPTDGDGFDTAVVARASVVIGDLTFTAKNFGTGGNNYTIEILNAQLDNSATDTYVTRTESFGMNTGSYGESFLRIYGNAIKIFINPGVTTTDDIANLITASPQASKMITAVSAMPSAPSVTSVTSLSGGVDAYDSFTYRVSNGTAYSAVAKMVIKINPVNDPPRIPRLDSSIYSHTETMLEETVNHTITFPFKDFDSRTTDFVVDVKVDTTTPTCSTAPTNADFTMLTTSTYFTIAPSTSGPATCTASGDCSVDIALTANLDFSGSACLYYRVTDFDGAVSDIQPINIVVTPFNDTPLLSASAMPSSDPLLDTSIMEDLDSGISYIDIYAGAGGGVFEESQKLTLTVTSDNTVLIPNTTCKNYTLGTVNPIGSVVPAASGLYYFDRTNLRCYVSTGNSLNTDWAYYPSLTAFPACGSYDYYGQGTPVGSVTTSTSGKHYLDTTNNVCYVSDLSLAAVWKQDTSISNYKLALVPVKDQSGTANIKVKVQDDGGTANSAVDFVEDTFQLTVNFVNDPPVFLAGSPTSVHTNEGGAIQTDAFYVDEDEGSTVDEDSQSISVVSITSDNQTVLPDSAISVFYDLNDNGIEDAGESRAIGMGDDFETGSTDSKLHAFYLKIDPVDGVAGNANITITITDDDPTDPKTNSTVLSLIVHPVAALHGGWTNISSVGIKTDKGGAPVTEAEIQCNYNKSTDTHRCDSTNNCTGTASPHSTVVPGAANVLYWDSANKRCYRSTSTSQYSWVDFTTSCPITRETGLCSGDNCITGAAAPAPLNSIIPSKTGIYYYNTNNKTCYVSTGKSANTQWQVYVPSKVTLTWKPFTMTGSGASSGAQIAGWNIYRREAGVDFDFKGGHLKDSNSTSVMTVTNPATLTYTDKTAVAGKVYYYVVRPVDNLRSYPTYTSEIFSEVRVLAAPTNYSFVHRWMVNQEICNGMKITTTPTTKNGASAYVDPTNNFRCQYIGPGGSGGYYDYGRDLIVDISETGCPYAAAPKCSSNGCIGIGAPSSTTNVVTDDLYYDRSTGSCYRYSGGWATIEATGSVTSIAGLLNTALNAPLVNITEGKAETICSARSAPTGTDVTFGAVTLPSKKDYNAYASHDPSLDYQSITDLEQGLSLNINSRCNGSQASGLSSSYTGATIPSTSFIYSLPGTDTSAIRSIYTGSVPWGLNKGTEACVSRFGIQDVYGNVAEWTTDKMDCSGTAGTTAAYVCKANSTSSFYSYLFGGASTYYGLDYLSGPYNDANGDGLADGSVSSPTDAFITSWTFSDGSYGASKFSYPIGLPINGDIDNAYIGSTSLDWIQDIGPSSGIVPEDLHEDGMIINGATINAAATKTGAFAVGGSYLSGQRSGRFTSELIQTAISRKDVGMRCIVPISSTTGYPADSKHTYPY